MKKIMVILAVALLASGCSSISIKQSVKINDDSKIREKLGDYSIMVLEMPEDYLKYIQSMDRQSQLGDDKFSDELQSIKYVKNQYFLFEIRHINVYPVKKWNFKISIVDKNENSLVEKTMYMEKLFQDTVVGEAWILKLKKPVSVENYMIDRLPLRLKVSLFEQNLEYQISPK